MTLATDDATRDGHVYQFPASFTQQRLWFLDQLLPGSSAYNIDRSIRLTGPLEVAVLENSIGTVVQRHESFRTTFTTLGGKPVQVVHPALTVPLPLVDLQNLPEPARPARARELAEAEARRPFDLARGPLLRTTLLRLAPQEHL